MNWNDLYEKVLSDLQQSIQKVDEFSEVVQSFQNTKQIESLRSFFPYLKDNPSWNQYLKEKMFFGFMDAGEPHNAVSVIAWSKGEEKAAFETLANATQSLLASREPEARELALEYIQFLGDLSSKDEIQTCLEQLTEYLEPGLPHEYIQAILSLLHHKPNTDSWWRSFLEKSIQIFQQAEMFMKILQSYEPLSDISAFEQPEIVFQQESQKHMTKYIDWISLKFLYPALINLFSLSREARHFALQQQEFLAMVSRVSVCHSEVVQLRDFLRMVDQETFVILYPEEGKGFEVVVEGSLHMQDFQPLMHDVLHGDPNGGFLKAPKPPQKVVDCFRGIGPMETEWLICNQWSCYSWPALQQDKSLLGSDYSASWKQTLGDLATDNFEVNTLLKDAGSENSPIWENRDAESFLSYSTGAANVSNPENGFDPNRFWVDNNLTPQQFLKWEEKRIVLLTGRISKAEWRVFRSYPYLQSNMELKKVLNPSEVEQWLQNILQAKETATFHEQEAIAYENSQWVYQDASSQHQCIEHAWQHAQKTKNASLLYRIGRQYYQSQIQSQKSLQEVWTHLREMKQLIETNASTDTIEWIEAHILLASFEFANECFEDSKKTILSTLEAWDVPDVSSELDASHVAFLDVAGKILLHCGENQKALECYQLSCRKTQGLEPLLQAQQLRKWAKAIFQADSEQIETTTNQLLKANGILRTAYGDWHPYVASCMLEASAYFYLASEDEMAEACFSKAESICKELYGGFLKKLFSELLNQAAYFHSHNLHGAFFLYQKAIPLSELLHGEKAELTKNIKILFREVETQLKSKSKN